MLPTPRATKSKLKKYKKKPNGKKTESFSLKPFWNGFCSQGQNSCIIYYSSALHEQFQT
jgi:hypothetical protein